MSGLERVLEIAASTRVLRERRLRALDDASGGALLGREFLNLRGLAERCAAETGVPVRHRLGNVALTRLVASCAKRSEKFGPLIAERPGFAAALGATLRDLRDAGVAPSALPDELADLRALYGDMQRALEKLASDGCFDRIGLFRLAVSGAPAWVARRGFSSAEVHGATELVGSAGDLIDALAAALPQRALRFLQPDFASEYAQALRDEWPWSFAPEQADPDTTPALDRDGSIPEGALRVSSATSPREELERVACEVLALIESGVAPREILIVARALEPYAAWLPPIFDGYALPVSSSLSRPAVMLPEARSWLDLVRVLGRDLERAPMLRLLERICPREVARLAEQIARAGAVVRGADDWRAALDEAADSPERSELRAVLERCLGAGVKFAAARNFRDAVAVALALAGDLPGDECRAAIESVRLLDDVDRAGRGELAPNSTELAGALEAVLLELRCPWHGKDEGGVRILDAIQARGLACSHLFLIGMVHGAWPREVDDDPFLPDRVRETLRSSLRRPVPIRGWALDEERFLLGLLLAQARSAVVISYPRLDGTGRALAPSALLRDLPFAARGTDVLPDDPTPERDESRFARAAAPLVSDATGVLERGCAQLRAIESTNPGDLRFDGAVGGRLPNLPDPLSPSFIDQLGRCPLQAFFERSLGARELHEPAPDTLDPTEAGSLVHDVLSRLYQALRDEQLLLAKLSPDSALERARALLPELLAGATRELRSRVRTRQPALWEAFTAQVHAAIDDLLQRDLRYLLPSGVATLELEQPIEATIPLGNDRQLRIAGKIDRIAVTPDGTIRVGDYKTSRVFDKPVSKARIRKGTSLQIPLYALAVAATHDSQLVIGEALPVPLRPERDLDNERDTERSISLEQIQALALPVLRELEGLLERGMFPFLHDAEQCGYCPYAVACRHEQPESRARLQAASGLRAWLTLRGQSS